MSAVTMPGVQARKRNRFTRWLGNRLPARTPVRVFALLRRLVGPTQSFQRVWTVRPYWAACGLRDAYYEHREFERGFELARRELLILGCSAELIEIHQIKGTGLVITYVLVGWR